MERPSKLGLKVDSPTLLSSPDSNSDKEGHLISPLTASPLSSRDGYGYEKSGNLLTRDTNSKTPRDKQGLATGATQRYSFFPAPMGGEKNRRTALPYPPLGQDSTSKPNRHTREDHYRQRQVWWWSWWWWELSAMLVSIACMSLISIILFRAHQSALSLWSLPIRINSLVAILTTIETTSLLVPVAGCLSQLKWRYYTLRPRPLDELQLLDDASRGPWGSLVLLLNFRTRTRLAWGLAFSTLASLGIGPAAQQIIEFPTRTMVMNSGGAARGVDVSIGRADTFQWKYTQDDFYGNDLPSLVKFDNQVMDVVLGQSSEAQFDCPATAINCTYPPFTTLGLCSDFRNETTGSRECNATHCVFDWPGQDGGVDGGLGDVNPFEFEYNCTTTNETSSAHSFDSIMFAHFSQDEQAQEPGSFRMTGIRVPPGSKEIIEAELFQSQWYWCAQTYVSASATAAGLSNGPVSSSRLSFVHWAIDRNGTSWNTYMDPSTGAFYNVSTSPEGAMWAHIQSALGTNSWTCDLDVDGVIGWNSANMQAYIYQTGLDSHTAAVATAISSHVRSRGVQDMLGNIAATSVPGLAFGTETYIQVRWEWLTIPLLEIVFTSGLLAATIIVTRSSTRPMLTQSILGLMFHGIDRLEPGDVAQLQEGHASKQRLGMVARDMIVQLREDDDGMMRFKRM